MEINSTVLETANAYIPMDRRQAMAHNKPLADQAQGAVLFADVSGFTPLTETLVNTLGRKLGAEELTRQLNLVYDALITQIHYYKGSVLGFSGDAITCWFDEDNGLRAIACALTMQQAMTHFAEITTPTGDVVSLGMKVGITTGSVRRFLIGDPTIQTIDVLAGNPLDQVAIAEGQAEKGDILVAATTIKALSNKVKISKWRTDTKTGEKFAVVKKLTVVVMPTPWDSLPTLTQDNPLSLIEGETHPWLLPPVYKRLQSGQGRFLAEIRPAVALFLKFSGLDYDHDDTAGEKLNQYIIWVQRVLARYESYMLQLTIGDKGCYLYAAFGALIAHEDDMARAVAAAVELRSPPSAFEYIQGIQIGLSYGQMRVGAYGGQMRRTYGVLGDEVNIAARLMGKAEAGQILVTEYIVEANSKYYKFESMGQIYVKGKKEPLTVAIVNGRHQLGSSELVRTFQFPLIGRNAELTNLEEILESSNTVKGQIARIEGAAGIGKSRLTGEFAKISAEKGVLVGIGICHTISQSIPYYPWRQIFWALLNLTENNPVADLEAIMTITNPEWEQRVPLLGDLLDLPIPDTPTTEAFDPKLRQQALFALVSEIIQTWSKNQSLLLIIEDAHAMDEASLALTETLARIVDNTSICFVITHRPAYQTDKTILPDLSKLPTYQGLYLHELEPVSIAKLITAYLEREVTPLALDIILAQSPGNPLMVVELIDALCESKALLLTDNIWDVSNEIFEALQTARLIEQIKEQIKEQIEGKNWRLKDKATLGDIDLGIPDSVQGIILSRLDRLPENYQGTLKLASVIGQAFEFSLLRVAHPVQLNKNLLLSQMKFLEANHFIVMHIPPPYLTYAFKHNLTQEVTYDTLLSGQQRELHQSVGQALEYMEPEATEKLAHHSFLGQDWERALRYQLLAGEQATQLFANREAIGHFQKALKATEHLPLETTIEQRQKIHNTLGELLTTTGQYETGIQHLESALALAKEREDIDNQAFVCHWFARSYELRGEYTPALEWVKKGLEALAGSETSEAAELFITTGLINTRQGNYEQAFKRCESSLAIGKKLNNSKVLARTYSLLGHTTRLGGDNLQAINYFNQALDLYKQIGDINGQAISHNLIGSGYSSLSEWTKADYYYHQARDIFSQTGDIYNKAIADNNLGEIARRQGRLINAINFYENALQALTQIGGSIWILGVLHNNLGATFIRREDVESATKHLQTSQAYFEQAQSRDFLPEMYRLFAEVSLLVGEIAKAETQGQKALSLAKELTMQAEQGYSLRILGEIATLQMNFGQAELYLKESLALLKEVGNDYEWGRSQVSLAKLYILQHQSELALTAFEQAIAIFERLEATMDLELAQGLRATI